MSQVPRPVIVLDTNVVLDWLLFADPSSTSLAAAIEGRQLRWLATVPMRSELAEVLRRGLAAKRSTDASRVLMAFDAHAEVVPDPELPPRGGVLACTDPADQKFLDLAHTSGARWLLSRDRAVLKLARRAAVLHLTIATPERWIAPA